MSSETVATIRLWGTEIGAVYWDPDASVGVFEYTPEFLKFPVEVSPVVMPKRSGIFKFPELAGKTYHGLPGLLADSLPDKFGNALIDRWCAEQGRESMNPVERLLYIGSRGMGALEYEPAIRSEEQGGNGPLDVPHLVQLSNEILNDRENFSTQLPSTAGDDAFNGLSDILLVGTSAGGARAKAVIAWNRETSEVRSGQFNLPKDFEHYLMKFDGVTKNRDKESFSDPLGFGRLEFAYYLMAREVGVEMMPCELYEENGRAHFLTKRFDRVGGRKLHMQSLCGLAHYDFNLAGAYSYEQAFKVMHLILGVDAQPALDQQYLRMVFNVIARNQDDHTKNIAFLMERDGSWKLSPAFDVTYAYNPQGKWTNGHQMTVGGKRGIEGRDPITNDDLINAARAANITAGKAKRMINHVKDVVSSFQEFARQAKVSEALVEMVVNGVRI